MIGEPASALDSETTFETPVVFSENSMSSAGHSKWKNYPFCLYQSLDKKGILRHIKSKQALEKPFSCPRCPIRFASKKDFIIHTRIHTGERPYECPICKLRFRRLQHLRGHLNRKLKCSQKVLI